MSEIRKDYLRNDYVIVAPERLHRPIEMECKSRKNIKNCPFCPGKEHLAQPEIYSLKIDGKWQTRVVPNLYKAVMIETPLKSREVGVNEKFEGFGAHEVIIDTPRHIRSFDMNEKEIFYWLKTIKARVEDLKKDKRLSFINVFKNDGENAGASQTHPHTQIIALPLMSNNQKRYFEFLHNFYLNHGRSALDDLFENEKESEREIIKSDNFLVFAPYASEFAFEVAILSKNSTLENLNELSVLIKKVFKALKDELNEFDFNVLFYFSPLNKNFENETFFDDIDRFFRFFIRITPRIYKLAGFEISTNIKINPVLPEIAAGLLRKKIDSN